MIVRKTEPRFFVGDGEFKSLKDAKAAALTELLRHAGENTEQVVTVILANEAKVVDVLTTSESSLTKARKINGGRKQRRKLTFGETAEQHAAAVAEDEDLTT